MTYVRTVSYDEADGPVKEIYDEILAEIGRIPNVWAANSLRPEAMRLIRDIHIPIMYSETSGLTEAEKQMIATLVSALNKCRY